jgi:hypothetical protein
MLNVKYCGTEKKDTEFWKAKDRFEGLKFFILEKY